MGLFFTHSLTHRQRQEHPTFLRISSVSWQMAHYNIPNVHKASHTRSSAVFYSRILKTHHTELCNQQNLPTFTYLVQQHYAHFLGGHISRSTVTFIQQCLRISSQSASNVQWATWLLQTMSQFDYASFCSTKHMQTSPLLSSGMWHSEDLGQYFSPTWWFSSYVHSVSNLLWNVGTYLSDYVVSHHTSHHNKNASKFYWPPE